MELGGTDSITNLANATCHLWTAGIRFRNPFWPWIQYNPVLERAMRRIQTSLSSFVLMLENSSASKKYTLTVNTTNALFGLTTFV